jgi:hypothetical protein
MLGKEDYRPYWIPKRIIVKGKEIVGGEAMYGNRR